MNYRYNTRKQTDKARSKAENYAQTWLDKGRSPESVAKAVWNKFGYSTDVKDGKVRIWGFYNDEKRSDIRVFWESK